MSSIINDRATWLTCELLTGKTVTRALFIEQSPRAAKDKEPGEPEWSVASNAVKGVLEALGYEITQESGGLRITQGPIAKEPEEFHNPLFDPARNRVPKEAIGDTMAGLLKEIDEMHTFVGSGTTCYHVGLAMERLANATKTPYRQIIWTVNIALAARWSNHKEFWPVRRVHVPEGILDPSTSRYAPDRNPDWFAAFVVFSADGAFLNRETGKMEFYGNFGDVRQATSFFISKATNAIFCCLTSDKLVSHIRYRSGPTISLPKNIEAPVRCLVTDNKLDKDIESALESDGWYIVTSSGDWNKENPKTHKVLWTELALR